MALTMCDEMPVRNFHRIVGVGTVWENKQLTKAGKRSWKWKVGNYEGSCHVRDLFWPWLSERRRQQFVLSESKAPTRRSNHNSVCPNCGFVSTAAGIVTHRKRCDKEQNA